MKYIFEQEGSRGERSLNWQSPLVVVVASPAATTSGCCANLRPRCHFLPFFFSTLLFFLLSSRCWFIIKSIWKRDDVWPGGGFEKELRLFVRSADEVVRKGKLVRGGEYTDRMSISWVNLKRKREKRYCDAGKRRRVNESKRTWEFEISNPRSSATPPVDVPGGINHICFLVFCFFFRFIFFRAYCNVISFHPLLLFYSLLDAMQTRPSDHLLRGRK
jgi:hypothetical protein